jgi:hypothetical protein
MRTCWPTPPGILIVLVALAASSCSGDAGDANPGLAPPEVPVPIVPVETPVASNSPSAPAADVPPPAVAAAAVPDIEEPEPAYTVEGTVHAAEVSKKMVDKLKKKHTATPQIKPYLCKTDGTGLKANSCDVAFLSQAYHHLGKGKHVDYLKHLRTVIKPTGRVVIIEKYIENGMGAGTHGTLLSRLILQAEQAGWVPVRVELMTGTYHYIAILAQKDLFPPEPKPKSRPKKKPKTKPKPKTAAKGSATRSPADSKGK